MSYLTWFVCLLFVGVLTLKLCGIISWSWWWVAAPGVLAALLLLLLLLSVVFDYAERLGSR